MWRSDHHRVQAWTLVTLAEWTRDPDTAAALRRLAAKHEELADRAESQRQASEARSAPPVVTL
jgi:hypothetical protein